MAKVALGGLALFQRTDAATAHMGALAPNSNLARSLRPLAPLLMDARHPKWINLRHLCLLAEHRGRQLPLEVLS